MSYSFGIGMMLILIGLVGIVCVFGLFGFFMLCGDVLENGEE